MKKTILLLTGAAFFYFNANAQLSNQLVGKKLQVVSNLKTTISQMGQEVPSDADITNEFEIKSVTGKSVALTGTTKKMKIKVSVMGNEQIIDSDDSTTKENPQLAEAFKEIDKPADITIETGKSFITEDAIGGQNAGDVANVLFIPVSLTVQEGNKIIDSTIANNGSKSVDTITVIKVAGDEIILQIDNKLLLSETKQQAGMDVKVNMTSTSTATRVYDKNTGLLKSENKTFTSSGANEAMGQSFPMSIKGTATITVQ